MSGRSSRARLLAPSFLVVASAIACGGHSRGDGDGVAGGPGTSGSTFGGSGFGGSSNPPVPSCPTLAPAEGSTCYGSISCNYDPPAAGVVCGPTTSSATCMSGTWHTSQQIFSCNPPIPFTCPPTLPEAGSFCPPFALPTMVCSYPAALCGVETARCAGTWTVERCGQLGVAGQGAGGDIANYGGAPDFGGAPGDAGGAPQGGAP